MQPEPLENSIDREPIFNVPRIVLLLLGAMLLVHLLRLYVIDDSRQLDLLFYFAFVPARFTHPALELIDSWTRWWTPVSYSFLHGDWTHLIINGIWMLAFGSVVARRFGPLMFLVFCVICSVFGAIAHMLANTASLIPMLGASAIVSGCMGASVRFAFPQGRGFRPMAHRLPAQSLSASLRNPQAMGFVVVWFLINLAFGLGGEWVAGEGQSIAWQAHIGGFVVGFLGFSLFETRRNQTLEN